MNFLKLASERYSVRSFDSKAVEDDKLEQILQAARIAPTAVNYQPQKLYVVKSEDALSKLAGMRNIFGAPLAIIVCYDNTASWKNAKDGGHDSGEVDAAIITTHMMLQAWELGIGSCWMGSFSPSDVKKAFDIPGNEIPVAILALGYPATDCKPSDRHPMRKEIAEFTTSL